MKHKLINLALFVKMGNQKKNILIEQNKGFVA